MISRSASFNESENWDKVHANSQVFISINDTRRSQNRKLGTHEEDTRSMVEEDEDVNDVEEEEDSEIEKEPETQGPRRSERANKGVPPKRFGVGEVRVCHVYTEPRNYEEVIELPEFERRKWQDAMNKEKGT